jgi:hypothetical protein
MLKNNKSSANLNFPYFIVEVSGEVRLLPILCSASNSYDFFVGHKKS